MHYNIMAVTRAGPDLALKVPEGREMERSAALVKIGDGVGEIVHDGASRGRNMGRGLLM